MGDNTEKKNTMIRTAAQTAVLMGFLTLGSKLIGFIREMVMANYFGATFVTDAYVMAFTILAVIFGGFVITLSTVYIPIYSNTMENEGAIAGDLLTSRIINFILIVTIIISFIGIIFSDQVINILAHGFSGETAKLASYYVRIMFTYIIFLSISGILESYLQYKGIFLPQILSGYLISFFSIIMIIIGAYSSHYFIAFGLLIGYASKFITILFIAKRKGFRYTFSMKIDQSIVKMVKLALPTFVGNSLLYINMFIDKTIATKLPEGRIAALNYASLLNSMIMAMTITILSTIIYPKLTQANTLEQYDRFNDILSKGITVVIIITLPCSLGAILYSSQVVHIVYERGLFDSNASALTSSAFAFYGLGLLFMSVNDLLSRTYYSLHNMKTPMIFAGISVIINVVLNLTLVRYMEHNGLALATSIAAVLNSLMLYSGLRVKYPYIYLIKSRKKIIYIVLASILSISVSYVLYKSVIIRIDLIFMAELMHLLITVVTAGLIYLGLLSLLKIEEIKIIKDIFKVNKQ